LAVLVVRGLKFQEGPWEGLLLTPPEGWSYRYTHFLRVSFGEKIPNDNVAFVIMRQFFCWWVFDLTRF